MYFFIKLAMAINFLTYIGRIFGCSMIFFAKIDSYNVMNYYLYGILCVMYLLCLIFCLINHKYIKIKAIARIMKQHNNQQDIKITEDL